MKTWAADLVLVTGLVLVTLGLWHFSPSVAIIVAGVVLIAMGLLFWRGDVREGGDV